MRECINGRSPQVLRTTLLWDNDEMTTGVTWYSLEQRAIELNKKIPVYFSGVYFTKEDADTDEYIDDDDNVERYEPTTNNNQL